MTEPPVLPSYRTLAARLRASPPVVRPPSRATKPPSPEAKQAYETDRTGRRALVEQALDDLSKAPDDCIEHVLQHRCRTLLWLSDETTTVVAKWSGSHEPYWGRKLYPEDNPGNIERLRLCDLDRLMTVLGLPAEAVMFAVLTDADAWGLALLANASEQRGDSRVPRELFGEAVPGHQGVLDRLVVQRLVVLDRVSDTIELTIAGARLLAAKKTESGKVYAPNRSTVRVYYSSVGQRVPEYEGREAILPPGQAAFFHHPTQRD